MRCDDVIVIHRRGPVFRAQGAGSRLLFVCIDSIYTLYSGKMVKHTETCLQDSGFADMQNHIKH